MAIAERVVDPGLLDPQPSGETTPGKRRKRDWMLIGGAIVLIALGLFALFWPMFGHKYDDPVGKPFEPAFGTFLLGPMSWGATFSLASRTERATLWASASPSSSSAWWLESWLR